MTKKLYEAIKILRRSKSSQKQIKGLTESELKAVCEVCSNLLHGNLKISKESKIKLKRFKRPIKELSNRRISIKRKQEVINQQGGFLTTIAGIALPLLTDLLISTISKKITKRK